MLCYLGIPGIQTHLPYSMFDVITKYLRLDNLQWKEMICFQFQGCKIQYQGICIFLLQHHGWEGGREGKEEREKGAEEETNSRGKRLNPLFISPKHLTLKKFNMDFSGDKHSNYRNVLLSMNVLDGRWRNNPKEASGNSCARRRDGR